jgi:hypothetical protein
MRIPRAAATVATCWLALSTALAAMGNTSVPPPGALAAEQIVDKSVEVRGGLQAWQKISTIIWVGHLESERSPVPGLPFRLEEKRPGKSRFAITGHSQRSVRVFDGMNGWKMRPAQDGRPEVKRFTAQEARFARTAYGATGPKGTVSVRFRDYKEVEGLALPSVFEINGAAGGKPDRMVIERVALNPVIDDCEFDGVGPTRERSPAAPGAEPR